MDQLKVALNLLKKYHFWILLAVVLLVGLFIWHTASASLSEQFAKRKADLESKKKAVSEIAGAPKPPNLQVVDAIKQQHNRLREEVYQAWMYLYQLQQRNNPWPNLGPEFAQMIAQLTAEELKDPDKPREIPIEFRDLYLNFIQEHVKTLGDIVQARRPKDLFEEEGTTTKPGAKGKQGSEAESAADSAGSGDTDAGQTASDSKKLRKKLLATARGTTPGMLTPGAMPGIMPGASPEATMSGYGTGGMSGVEMVGVVDWLDEANLLARFNWLTTPSTEEIRLAQEDLWVYEALLRIIADTNRPATTQYAAVVKKIFSLEIAQQAAAAFQSAALGRGGGLAMMPGMGGMYGSGYPGMPGMSGMPGGYPGMPEMGSSAMGTSAAGSSAADTSAGGTTLGASPDMPGDSGLAGTPGMPGAGMAMLSRDQMARHFRYVDLNGNPLPANAKPPFAEFKMMPVRMYLLVDQRRLHRLLANCANSSMPVEVRRVRIRPEQGLDFSAFSGAAMMGGTGPMGGMSGYPGASSGYPGGMGGYPGGTPGFSGSMPGMPGGLSGMPSGYPGAPGGPSGLMGPSMTTPSMTPGGTPEMPGAGPYGSSYGAGGTGTAMAAEESWDVPVEILGIIYIFNPPNRSKLGTGAATLATASGMQPTEAGAATSTESVAPAAVPGAGQAPAAAPSGSGTPAAGAAGASGPVPAAATPPGPAAGSAAPAAAAPVAPGAQPLAPAAPGAGPAGEPPAAPPATAPKPVPSVPVSP